jgi:hypothetical protein
MVRRAPAPPAREAGKGTKDEEHAMSAKFNSEIAVIGIDIGKNSFTSWVWIGVERSCCARSGPAAKSKHGSPTYRRV